jgi:hypothetical protein
MFGSLTESPQDVCRASDGVGLEDVRAGLNAEHRRGHGADAADPVSTPGMDALDLQVRGAPRGADLPRGRARRVTTPARPTRHGHRLGGKTTSICRHQLTTVLMQMVDSPSALSARAPFGAQAPPPPVAQPPSLGSAVAQPLRNAAQAGAHLRLRDPWTGIASDAAGTVKARGVQRKRSQGRVRFK